MEKIVSQPKILIISGYHPKETFATIVGEYFSRNISNSDIKVVQYMGKPDRRTSTYNLRRFAKNFDPTISPIVLHGDDDCGFDAAIVYSAKSKMIKKKALKPLSDFISGYNKGELISLGRFLAHNTKYSLIDIELNSRMGLEKAVNLVEDFSKYLLSLYLEKGIKL